MAMSLTRAQLAVSLRITAAESDAIPDGQAAVLDRVLSASKRLIESYAPDAPDPVKCEATTRVASWLYDRAGHENRGGSPMVASGAAFLLSKFRSKTVTVPAAAEVG